MKYDLISWITGLDDKRLILKLHKLIKEQEITVQPKRNGSLTKGFYILADDASFDEANYSDQYEQLKNAFFKGSKRSMAQQIEKYVS